MYGIVICYICTVSLSEMRNEKKTHFNIMSYDVTAVMLTCPYVVFSYTAVMAPLEKAYFAGQSTIDDGDVRKAEVANFNSHTSEALKRFGWDGKAACCIGLRLTADNRRIESGQFITLGRTAENEI